MLTGLTTLPTMPQGCHDWLDAVRVYIDWDQIENQEAKYTFEPSQKNVDLYNFDSFFGHLKQQGVHVMACIQNQNNPTWLRASDRKNKPIPDGADPEDPMSYAKFAQMIYQFVVRYGSKTHPPENIKTYTDVFWGVHQNEALSGLNLIDEIMPGNEPNADWLGASNPMSGYFTPKQLAAYWSAIIDGHGGAIPHAGILNADPDIWVVFPGLAGQVRQGMTATQYLDAFMNEWGMIRNDLEGISAYAFHLYCKQDGHAVDPLTWGLTQKANGLRDWCRRHMSDCYITETGYDTGPNSNKTTLGYEEEGMDQYETQSLWLRQTLDICKDAGIDATYIYHARDDAASGTHMTSGIYGPKTDGDGPTGQTQNVDGKIFHYPEKYPTVADLKFYVVNPFTSPPQEPPTEPPTDELISSHFQLKEALQSVLEQMGVDKQLTGGKYRLYRDGQGYRIEMDPITIQ